MKKKNELFTVWQMRWVFLTGAVIIVGGIMSYGLIGYLLGFLKQDTALSMLAMIPLMMLVYGLAVKLMMSGLKKRLGRLVDGIHAVAEGDLDYQIDLKGAEEYRTVYREFNAMTAELKQTRQEMESFASGFAHEFKTPITSVSGFADYLYETGKGVETEERMEYLQIISEQSRRLCDLSQSTLLFSKLNAMEIVTGKETYSLGEQLRKCVILLQKPIEEKHITLSMPEDFDPLWTGNRALMEHVWINLLNNAVKFTPEGGLITISSHGAGDALSISISDTGSGMDEDTMAHIFDRFYQNNPSGLTQGNGIGLAIVKRAVELSGGTVTVESQPGQGSVFTVTLGRDSYE